MKTVALVLITGIAAAAVAACGGAPPPTARLSSSEAAIRSARELGAQNDPQAALHLKLADDQLQTAKQLIRDNENKRASMVLQRASSDAELSIMLMREKNAKTEAQKAILRNSDVRNSGGTPKNTSDANIINNEPGK